MARRRRRGPRDDELTLFDAPLNPPASPVDELPPAADDPPADLGESLPLFPEAAAPSPEIPQEPGPPESGREESGPAEPAVSATVPARLLAGLADLAIHAGVVALLLWGIHSFGVPISQELGLPVLLFLAAFSFLYTVVPLAFWGQTPGMASLGLLTCTADDQHLTFAQTARRWAAAVVTLALLGLPTLLAFGGRRSLADWVSGSLTVQLEE